MDPRVIGIAGPFQGQTLALPEGEVSIGREPANQLWAADAALLRRHCSLVRNGADIRILDLGSCTGTRVNSVPVTEQSLQHGDEISVGLSLFLFLQESATEETRSNPVEFEQTNTITGIAYLLPREETDTPVLGASAPTRLRGDLNALLKIATAISSIRDRESLQWQLLGFIFDVIPAERGSVLFFDSQGEVNSSTAWDRVHGPEHVVPVSQTILKRVVRERSGLLLTCPDENDRSRAGSAAAPTDRAVSLLCVPMIVGERVVGVIYLDTRIPSVQFDDTHLRVLQ